MACTSETCFLEPSKSKRKLKTAADGTKRVIKFHNQVGAGMAGYSGISPLDFSYQIPMRGKAVQARGRKSAKSGPQEGKGRKKSKKTQSQNPSSKTKKAAKRNASGPAGGAKTLENCQE